MLSLFLVAILWATSHHAVAQEISYQGQLLKSGTPFDGTASFKFAIVKGATIWSNDGTSENGSMPTSSVNIVVNNGVFNAMLGSAPMTPISGSAAMDMGGATLKIWVKSGSDVSFSPLPDQQLGSTPTALGVRQVDPALTGFLARWDGTKLSSAMIQVDSSGHVVIGPGAPADSQLRVNSSDGSNYAADFRNAGKLVSTDSSNFWIGSYSSVESRVAAGVTDSGYRVGVAADAIARTSDFQGLLAEQRGLWATAGTRLGSNGSVSTAYAAYLQTISGGGPVGQAYGVYQISEVPNSKNYFQSPVGIGNPNPSSLLSVAGFIESTSGGIKFPDGTVQSSAGGIRTINGSSGPVMSIQGSGGITVSTSGNAIIVSSGISTATCTYGARVYSVGSTCSTGTYCYNTYDCYDFPGKRCQCQTLGATCGQETGRYYVLTCNPNGSWSQSISECRGGFGGNSCGQ